ncbi:MAG: ketopantoate reductase family protein, partial [Terriglobales bacterium]
EVDVPDDIRKAIWEKFAFLVAMSSVTAATRQTIGPLRENDRTRALLVDVVNEAVSVAAACGVNLNKDSAANAVKYWDSLSPEVTSSMMHDLVNGNRLELPWLGGAVVDLGAKHGVATPVNRVLTGILSPYIAGQPANSVNSSAGN